MTLFQGKTAVLKIHADGKTEMYDAKAKALAPGPTVKADGTFNFKEQDVARANPDGTIKQLPSGETLPVTVRSTPTGAAPTIRGPASRPAWCPRPLRPPGRRPTTGRS